MLFSSLTFIAFFLPTVICLYFISRSPAWRNSVLLIFSLIFYAWGEPRFIVVMLLSILVNYYAALFVSRAASKRARVVWMLLGVGLSLGFLFWFKYYAFLANSLGALLGVGEMAAVRTLPIGISFYTFQIITYTVDVYRGKVPVQRNLPRLALYISFFPQLIAGPIVNYTYIEPYLAARDVSVDDFFRGLERFFLGLGKKVLIANVCGEALSQLTLTGGVSMLGAWLGALAYTLQIFFDFSGYSDMAIGMGRMFGFRFLENFRYPYAARSIADFWRRWHISLSAFFREYVYIPLGGNRVSPARRIGNLLTVWALTGIWHGASWNFLVWGAYYGLLLIVEKMMPTRALERIPGFLRWLCTMLLVIFGWVIFYHESLSDGLGQISAMLYFGADGLSDGVSVYCLKYYLGALIVGALAAAPWGELKKIRVSQPGRHQRPGSAAESRVAVIVRAVAASAVFLASLMFLAGSSYNPFLYFRF